ncbi:F-box/kelch-repeat protein At3g06240-like [Papaver somniferum]|uniref:F-box/kelch-repeat protein At3g06240-like n=1 Tax=Papaver somniferum TaxID=3469 RepID=UPI000E7030D4|nr:F-box/kelch-repeat protein At3g06240-like [Papaver somniferum]
MKNYDDNEDDLVEMDFALPSDFELYGSCNGIICIWNHQNNCFGFWNPDTMEYKDAPRSPNKYMYVGHDVYAFGYDAKNDDYKLVNMIDPEGVCDEDCNNGVKDGRWFVEVYTLGTDTWKNIEPIPYVFYRKAVFGVLVNGALHWWGDKRVKEQSNSTVIVSLDISDERFREMQLAEEMLGDDRYMVSIGALEGRLCVFVHVDETFHVWVMQEYGVQESWTKLYNINYRVFTSPYDIVRLVWSFKDGEILLQILDTDDLVLYDPVNGMLEWSSGDNISAMRSGPEVGSDGQ